MCGGQRFAIDKGKMTLKEVQQVNEHTVKLHYAIKKN